MKNCKSCGIILTGSVLVEYNESLLCKYCYKRYQSEQFKFWYDKNYKPVDKKSKTCVICGEEFESAWASKTTCSPECRKEHKRRTSLIRWRMKNDRQTNIAT